MFFITAVLGNLEISQENTVRRDYQIHLLINTAESDNMLIFYFN